MSHNRIHRKKNNGIFYTPEHVAALLAAQAITRRDISILDPACGTGGFLVESFEHLKVQCKRTEDFLKLQEASGRIPLRD